MILNPQEMSLFAWREKEKTALALLQIVGELRFDKSIDLLFFRKVIYDSRPSEVVHMHLHARNYIDKPISLDNSLTMAYAVANLPKLAPAKIDLGRLSAEWLQERTNYADIDHFVTDKLNDYLEMDHKPLKPKDVVLFGFGRVGRMLARRIAQVTGRGDQLRLRAIVVQPKLNDPYEEASKRAALLMNDSVHGKFAGTIDISPVGDELIINGHRIQIIYAEDREEIDYQEYGIHDALLIDNSGVWRDADDLEHHLRPGISKVLLTAPSPQLPNLIYGVNHQLIVPKEEKVVCAGSCTTNAIIPVLQIIHGAYTIEKGHVETIHSYTADQNLLDNFHPKKRRGRGAATNMVLTTTGASSAINHIFPDLKDKFTANAVRVPTPCVSLAILHITVKENISRSEINHVIEQASLHGKLVDQIFYSTSAEFVSSHAVGNPSTALVDAPSTIVSSDEHTMTIYIWYDNEFGYACQVVRLAKYLAEIRRFRYY